MRFERLDKIMNGCYHKKLYQYRQNAENSLGKGSFPIGLPDNCMYCTMLQAKNQEEIIKKFTAFGSVRWEAPCGLLREG